MTTLTDPAAPITAAHFSLPVDSKFRVDSEAGIIRGVSLITGDREATGHGIYLDQRTIETAFESLQATRGKLQAPIRHASLLDILKTGGDRIMDLPAFFSNARIEGNQIVADLEFYESFKQAHFAEFTHLMEIARKTPELMGVSIEPSGYLVFVAEDGVEFSTPPEDVPLQHEGMPVMRVTRLRVGAMVGDPAANDGLFAKFKALFSSGKSDQLGALKDIASAFVAWASDPRNLSAAQTAPDSAPYGEATAPPAESVMEKTITALKAKFSASPDVLNRAVAFVVEDPKITVEEVEQKLAAADVEQIKADLALANDDRDAMKAFIVALTDERNTLKASLTADRDEWKAKFEAIKNSGQPAAVDLGVGAGAAAPVGDAAKPVSGFSRVQAIFKAQAEAKAAAIRLN